MMKITLGIVAKTLFDAEVAQDAETVGQAMAILQDGVTRQFRSLVHLPGWLPTRQNRKEQRAINALDRIILHIINERQRSGEDKGDLLSMLLLAADEEGDKMSIQQVRDEVISLFLAGHETTANTLTWIWYLLSQHPAEATKLFAEVDTVLEGRAPTAQDMARLPYTTLIVKEGLRLYPPAWVITREAITETAIGGYRLKAGSVVVTSPYVTHRHPGYFAEPDQFRPERFSDDREKTLPRLVYFPFGGGPRICMGQSFALMEAVLILATIAQHYRLTLVPGHPVEMEPLVTLRARYGIRMHVSRRETA
jgi:cytochrome P450